MAELGVIASVVGVAGAALKSSQALIEIIDQVRSGPEELSAISRDTHSFHDVVTSVQLAIRDPIVIRVLQGDQKLFELVERLEGPLQSCALVLTQLKPRLQPHFKASSDGGLRVSNVDVRWMFKKKDILDCRNRLEATKSTLDAALTSVVFFCSLRSAGQDVYKLSEAPPRTTSRDTDAGSILKEYAESIAPRSPPLDATAGNNNQPHNESSFNLPSPLAATSGPSLIQDEGSAQAQYPSASRPNQKAKPSYVGGSVVDNSPIDNPDKSEIVGRESDYLIALQNENVAALQRMLEAGFDPNKCTSDGYTALHLAALKGHYHLAQTLILAKADIDALTSKTHSTPLHYAAQSGHEIVATLFLAHYARTDIGDSFGETALHNAIRADHDDIAILLIHCGAPLFQPDHRGRIPLHFASSGNRIRVVDALLGMGRQVYNVRPMVDAKNNDGLTPLGLAATDGYNDIAERLLKAGADANTRSAKGNTPLMAAARNGQLETISLLVSYSADRYAKNRNNLDYEQILEKYHPDKYEECRWLRAEDWLKLRYQVDRGHP